jgi:hypothetical protein
MYRVVNANVVFETLWSLISFGHGKCDEKYLHSFDAKEKRYDTS